MATSLDVRQYYIVLHLYVSLCMTRLGTVSRAIKHWNLTLYCMNYLAILAEITCYQLVALHAMQ